MKKKIVLSVNDNPDYLYYVPLVCWAWQQFGWEPILFYHGGFSQLNALVDLCLGERETKAKGYVLHVDGYESETITQISRLYAACVADQSDYLMTGDIDMLPLSNYWKPVPGRVAAWGHDLTEYQHYPICYIGMQTDKWKEVMMLNSKGYDFLIKRDLDSLPQAKSEDRVKRWVTDQDLITERIDESKNRVWRINRGTLPNGYPVGRVDRSAWNIELPELIDCHMMRGTFNKAWTSNPKFIATLELLKKVWPAEDFQWFIDYSFQYDQIVSAK